LALLTMHAIESTLELLGYNQHRDFHVHGVPHVAAIDFANTSTGQATTATDDKCVQPVAGAGNLTPSDLAGHVKGDYGSEGWGFESLRARSVLRRKLDALEMSGAFGIPDKPAAQRPAAAF
jgi:hypothetical protein